jgi:dTDP-glucose 4,6-dehydratase
LEVILRLLVTGGAGFIGSNFVRHYLSVHEDCEVVNLDKLTYAGNLENLRDVENDARYTFVHGDICDAGTVEDVMDGVDAVINFAAETHVDRAIGDPSSFLRTDIFGVHVLLEEAKARAVGRFVQISTDEVYGPTEGEPLSEEAALRPRNPYSASKAGGELLARSYFATYGLPVIVTRASNNVGPFQYPEKVVPLFATNAIDDEPLPLYGDGLQERDYMHVSDHVTALDLILEEGVPGEVYNIGAGNHMQNVDMARLVVAELGKPERLITHVRDREGHDVRYAIDSSKLRSLGWAPTRGAESSIRDAVRWYARNEAWWRPLKSGEFREYYERQYGRRFEEPPKQD